MEIIKLSGNEYQWHLNPTNHNLLVSKSIENKTAQF